MANIISFFALILAITIHEFSHALTADYLGDPTPRSHGRLSLNPLAHADLFGTILLPLLGALTGLPVIGWAKPVPIDPYNLKNPKRDRLLVALAGPASNLLLAIVFALVLKLTGLHLIIFYLIILVNVSLAVFNLIPVPPLDGSQILLSLLPDETSLKWEEAFERYGLLLLIVLIIPFNGTSVIGAILGPATGFLLRFLSF